MDHLQRAVLMLIVAAQWKLLISAPTPHVAETCQNILQRASNIFYDFKRETDDLFAKYISEHGSKYALVPPYTPDATLSGNSVSERLQSVYVKAELFLQHIRRVQDYHQRNWSHIGSLGKLIKNVLHKCQNFAITVQKLVKALETDAFVLPTTAPPNLPPDNITVFEIKVYGWAVLLRMTEWQTFVEQVLLAVDCTAATSGVNRAVGRGGKMGFQEMVLLWMVVMLQGFDARHLKKIGNKCLSCKLKQLSPLTTHQVEVTLTLFDEANGKHLGTWLPGFPALTVEDDSPLVDDKMQCSLLFLVHGLKKILEDQRDDLNPEDVALHKALKQSISRVELLAVCLRAVRGGMCSSLPPAPKMPQNAFERKQWSHTLLKTATHYLHWLQDKLLPLNLKKSYTIIMNQKATRPMYPEFIEGSGYLL